MTIGLDVNLVGLVSILAMIFGLTGWLWKAHISAIRAEKKAEQNANDVQALRLDVAEKYASIEHLDKTEGRLTDAISDLRTEIRDLPERLARLLGGGASR